LRDRRRALELAPDGTDLVSRLLSASEAGDKVLVVGAELRGRESALALLLTESPGSVDVELARPVPTTLFAFISQVARRWRGMGELLLLIDGGNADGKAQSRRPAAGRSVGIYRAGSRAAWNLQAELAAALARPVPFRAPVVDLIRDDQLRKLGDSWFFAPRAAPDQIGRELQLAQEEGEQL